MYNEKVFTMGKKYIFFEPYCLIHYTSKLILIYNSILKSTLNLKVPNKGKIKLLFEKLDGINNLYTIEVDDEIINDASVQNLINSLRNTFSGDFVCTDNSNLNPVVMYPKLKLKRQHPILKEIESKSVGIDILSYLHEITFYINGKCDSKCSFCNQAYKQALFCTTQVGELPLEVIHKIMKYANGSSLNKINIIGGDIFQYHRFENLINCLKDIEILVNFHFHLSNIKPNIEKISFTRNIENTLYSIKIDPDLHQDTLKESIQLLKDMKINFVLDLVVFDINDLDLYICAIHQLSKYKKNIIPIFNGQNIDFFTNYVYLNEDDITSTSISKRQLLAKSVINTVDFGKLSIMPDGFVYSNVNLSPIANIKNSLYEMIQNELDNKKSWYRIRTMKPCSECIYQWLCPPPSNYELVLDRPNLCLVT